MKLNVNKICTFLGHKDAVYALSEGEENRYFYSAGGDGLVVKWDLKEKGDGKVVAKVDASVYAMHYLREKKLMVIGQNYEGIHILDVSDKKVVGSLKFTSSAIFNIKYLGDNIYIATGEGILVVVDLPSLTVKAQLKISDKSLRTLSVINGEDLLMIGSSDHNIYILDTKEEVFTRKIENHQNSVFTSQYLVSSNTLITGSRDAHLKFWDLYQDFDLIESIPAHMQTINNVVTNPEQTFIATGSMDKTVKIWDAKSRKLLKVIDKERNEGHLSSVNQLFWSNFNNYLISTGDDKAISVWDLQLID